MGEQDVEPRRGTLVPALSAVGRALTALARALAFMALIALLIPVVARFAGWEGGPLAVLVSLMPWVTLACLVPIVLALLARAWVLLAASVAVAGLCLWWIAPILVASTADGPVALRVGTFSLANGGADTAAVVDLVREHDLDLLALTELTPEAQQGLEAAGLDELLPYSVEYPGDQKYGTGLWSAAPLAEGESLPGFTAQAIRTEVGLGEDRLTVIVAHPESPGVLDHSDWDADLVALKAVLADEDGPVIVAGDLNTTRDHQGFRQIESYGYEDAVDQAGAGFLATYPSGTFVRHHVRGPGFLTEPLVAIDHILVKDAGIVAAEVDAVEMPRSDHRALVAVFREP
ncbi:endonuclease/exonuclease/phosphatase family protein [Demequina sp. SYSU T00192]|uniref:Endonuclease/exonuclease/phosphatase family protein n=1 Tax=Demequina litoralis TaxID=3051660 RepID=A0ABT8GEA2_9MICO|nr:endonuclease/exonuclease/phosphatase family protein [Demequina sp. SYSU T00192]MDN4477004.1 endonuclease/exonuclease/phosphatase family protein [Demequina sp. SYSU T00192]